MAEILDAYTCPPELVRIVPPRVWPGRQAWHYRATYRVFDLALRVDICRDGQDGQSWARAEVFSPATHAWNLVASRSIGECSCRSLSYVAQNATPDLFDADDAALRDEAVAVLAASRSGPN